MNLHLPQTEEAKAEAVTLMGVSDQSFSVRHIYLNIFCKFYMFMER